MRPIVNAAQLVMDVEDLERAAMFWGALTDTEPGPVRSGGDYLTVGPIVDGLVLVLQRVGEAKAVKNRVHLDFVVDDIPHAVAQIIELGGTRLLTRFTGDGATMADPDGNEFCLMTADRACSAAGRSYRQPSDP